ncbi:hypothetical protein [Halorubrum sp. AJ67]|uniref:hypothetical protein n=1 Tax=Halorubrum sp. AJ67 TaxID=1173487 RepID=UPI0003DCEB47|nr:hypothetical protein [Halorubrum sp. AJ67]CDK38746.1 uncharacterized protein BN903_40 [Halorubrum sp. AJ67]
MVHDPLSPSEALRTPAGAVLGGVSLFVLAYSLVIVGAIFVGLVAVGALSVGPYLWYRIFAAVDAIADGIQRLAAAKEREVDRDSRSDELVGRDTPDTRDAPAERATERER